MYYLLFIIFEQSFYFFDHLNVPSSCLNFSFRTRGATIWCSLLSSIRPTKQCRTGYYLVEKFLHRLNSLWERLSSSLLPFFE